MKKYAIAYILVSLVFYGTIFYFKIHHFENITKIIIPVFVFSVLLFVATTNRLRNRRNILLFCAFLAIFAGDVLINLTKHKELSILPFGLTHVLLMIYYIREVGIRKKDFIVLVPIIGVNSGLILLVLKDIKNSIYLFTLMIYLGILGMMLWRALCFFRSGQNRLKVWLIAAGSSLFFLTDILVGLHAIYHQFLFIVLIWLVYPPALVLLSLQNVYKIFGYEYSYSKE